MSVPRSNSLEEAATAWKKQQLGRSNARRGTDEMQLVDGDGKDASEVGREDGRPQKASDDAWRFHKRGQEMV